MPIAKRRDDRIIIHFDYDCFYASVFESENPSLKSLPLAVQQKQIVVTCNYEARRRGLHKLQLITEAKKICPDVVIVLGEDLTRFRDASKILYTFLEAFTWNKKVERLGFDEVFMDVTDIIDYNQDLLNHHDLGNSFFQLAKNDPTQGFSFDGRTVSGHSYPENQSAIEGEGDQLLHLRLILASHLAHHLRRRLEQDRGYTATVGISTTKLIAKLAGNLHKPKDQTTLLPPYTILQEGTDKDSNITTFIDAHDIGKIPGIGFKTAHQIRNHILARTAAFDQGLIYGNTKENVTVRDVRLFPGMGPELLEKILGGKPGAERGIGGKIWNLVNGVDNTEVKNAKTIPSQISIEDSYVRLDTLPQVSNELGILATSLIRRMHMDLVVDDDNDNDDNQMDETRLSDPVEDNRTGAKTKEKRRWLAHPKTIRLSTRPRPPLNQDGTRSRSFNRISRSAPLPSHVFNLRESIDAVVNKLVNETLLPMFRKLHPEKAGWNLSLVNVCVANMTEDGKGSGRDIGTMFRKQDSLLREWRVEDRDVPPDGCDVDVDDDDEFDRVIGDGSYGQALQNRNSSVGQQQMDEDTSMGEIKEDGDSKAEPSAGNDAYSSRHIGIGSEDLIPQTQESIRDEMRWDDDDDEEYRDGVGNGRRCGVCEAYMPAFAMPAHERLHVDGDEED